MTTRAAGMVHTGRAAECQIAAEHARTVRVAGRHGRTAGHVPIRGAQLTTSCICLLISPRARRSICAGASLGPLSGVGHVMD